MDVQGIWKTLTSRSTCLWFHYLGDPLQVWEWKTGGDPGSSHHAAAGHLQDWGAKGTSCGMASDEVNYSLPFQSSVTRKLFSSTSLTKQNNKISELKRGPRHYLFQHWISKLQKWNWERGWGELVIKLGLESRSPSSELFLLPHSDLRRWLHLCSLSASTGLSP